MLFGLLAPKHDGLHEKLKVADAAIAAEPGRAELWLTRAELRRLHEDFTGARADLGRACQIDAGLAGLELAWARLELAQGRVDESRVRLAAVLTRDPGDLRALVLRAEMERREGQRLRAVLTLSRVIALDPAARPALYLERSELLVSLGAGYLPAAVRGLDQGIARLGALPVLELRAIELELELGRCDAALGRVDRLAAPASRQERWLLLRGDVLARGGREDDARAAWNRALEQVRGLPAGQKGTRATRRIELELEERLSTQDQ